MKRKSILKQVLCLLLIVCCTATCFNSSMVQAQAAEDVTNSFTFNVETLCGFFPSTCGYDLIYNMKIGQKKKYDFSKESTRRHTIYCDWAEFSSYTDIDVSPNEMSKRVFGKKTSKIDTNGGEWGNGGPTIKIKKIYKLSSGKYKVKANVCWNVADSNGKVVNIYKIGDLTINLKKKSKSYYGYIVKSMTLKKVAD